MSLLILRRYSTFRIQECYKNSPDQYKRFEIIRYSDQFGATFVIRNRIDGKCVTAGSLDQPRKSTKASDCFFNYFKSRCLLAPAAPDSCSAGTQRPGSSDRNIGSLKADPTA